MIYYIHKLKEDFKYDYINDSKYNISASEIPLVIYMDLGLDKSEHVAKKMEWINAQSGDKVADVSKIRRDGSNILFVRAPGPRSTKKQVPGYKIYSDNLKSIIITAKLMGDYSIISLWKNN